MPQRLRQVLGHHALGYTKPTRDQCMRQTVDAEQQQGQARIGRQLAQGLIELPQAVLGDGIALRAGDRVGLLGVGFAVAACALLSTRHVDGEVAGDAEDESALVADLLLLHTAVGLEQAQVGFLHDLFGTAAVARTSPQMPLQLGVQTKEGINQA